MRRPAALVLALLLVAALAAPAQAATVRRVFTAGVGTSSANGVIRITAYTEGGGVVSYAMKGLKKKSTYRVEVRKGRCASLGTVVYRPSAFTTDANGAYTSNRSLSASSMGIVWNANMQSLLAVRIYSGTSIRCGNFSFTRATRVYMPTQELLSSTINLAVVRSPSGYPYCNVAMYMGALSQPTEPGVTFLFAHARKGMFYPLYLLWTKDREQRLIGKSFYVYTSNNLRHQYVIDRVRVIKTLDGIFGITAERAWLQTSTGPNYTYPKLVVEGKRVATVPVSYASAHPTAKIVKCG